MQENCLEKRRLAVKAIITLITNWRSAAETCTTMASCICFYQGSWFLELGLRKQAVELALFNPALAKSNILSMFDYMDDFGMVADCIYWISRKIITDTKPPLAAWAVSQYEVR